MADNHGESLSIGKIRVTQTAGESRVEALVDGTPLWFASPDASFRVSSEGFLSAMLLPAMTTRRPLAAIDAACDVWLDNVGGAIDLFRQFRRLDAIDVIAPRLASVAATPPAGAAPGTASSRSRIALAFSGGVDSFHTLLRYERPIESLVYVEDYDMPSNGKSWSGRFDRWLRAIGDETGKRTILVRTNLKRHPAFRGTSWYDAHGACLAAVGHLLADHFDTLVLSSSLPREWNAFCGTHWTLDPLWSSARLQVTSFGEPTRSEKLVDIAAERLVQRMLRCCWENLNDRMNCGECEKCLRTEVILASAGHLEKFSVFAHPVPLAERVARLRCIRAVDIFQYKEWALNVGLPDDLSREVAKLLARSQRLAEWRGFRGRVSERWRSLKQSLPSLFGRRRQAVC